MAKPTMTTIARRAGVSVSTVSYALSGKRPISPEVREKIRQVIDSLGYRPDALARSFSVRETRTIGFYAQKPENMRANAYFSAVLAGILSVLENEGFQLVLYPSHATMLPDRESKLITRQPVDGIIILDQGRDDLYHRFLHGLDMPHVFLGRPRTTEMTSYVMSDHFGNSFGAVEHLASRGRTRIALVNHPGRERGSSEKLEGYKAGLEQCGLSYSRVFVTDGFQAENGERLGREIVAAAGEIDALVTHNHLITFGIVKALTSAGINVPDDVSIVSAGEQETNDLQLRPFTAMTMDPFRNGVEAAQVLLGHVRGELEPPIERVIPSELKLGWTT